jgi:chemotaxis protein CheX
VKFLSPFVDAAFEVLRIEAGVQMSRGDLTLEKEPYISEDVTVILSLVGDVVGNVFFGMNTHLALVLVSNVIGEQITEFSGLAQSGIAELGNVITGQASIKLSDSGYQSTISPPTLLCGRGAIISTLDYPRIVVPLRCEWGLFNIHLALRDSLHKNTNTAQIPVPAAPNIMQRSNET